MTTEIANPEEKYKISPEALEIASTYMTCHDTKETAEILGIAPEKVNHYLRKADVKRFIDTIFLEQGYMNRSKIQDAMDEILEIKIAEMHEAEIGSNKDIIDILALQHKMRMDQIKATADANPPQIKNQLNIQQNSPQFGANIDALVGILTPPVK